MPFATTLAQSGAQLIRSLQNDRIKWKLVRCNTARTHSLTHSLVQASHRGRASKVPVGPRTEVGGVGGIAVVRIEGSAVGYEVDMEEPSVQLAHARPRSYRRHVYGGQLPTLEALGDSDTCATCDELPDAHGSPRQLVLLLAAAKRVAGAVDRARLPTPLKRTSLQKEATGEQLSSSEIDRLLTHSLTRSLTH